MSKISRFGPLSVARDRVLGIVLGDSARYRDGANYDQLPIDKPIYRQLMSPTDRDDLVGNIVWHLSQGVERFIQERAVKSYLYPIDPDLGARVAKGLG
jgi:catalase